MPSLANCALVANHVQLSKLLYFAQLSKSHSCMVCKKQASMTRKCHAQPTVNSEIFVRVYFRETLHMRSFVKNKILAKSEITLSFTDIGKSCPSHNFLASQIHVCLLTLFTKIKFSQKFLDLQYPKHPKKET